MFQKEFQQKVFVIEYDNGRNEDKGTIYSKSTSLQKLCRREKLVAVIEKEVYLVFVFIGMYKQNNGMQIVQLGISKNVCYE